MALWQLCQRPELLWAAWKAVDFNTGTLGGHPCSPTETEAAVRATLRAALEQLQETVDLPAGLVLPVVEPAKPEHRSAVL